jgi:hypothetical protein
VATNEGPGAVQDWDTLMRYNPIKALWDPAHWFRGHAVMSQPFSSWPGRHVSARSVAARGVESYPRSLPHLRRR